MRGWLMARNRPPFAAYASPGPSGNSVVAGASVLFDLTDATSKETSAGRCANSTGEKSPTKTTLDNHTARRTQLLTPAPRNCSAHTIGHGPRRIRRYVVHEAIAPRCPFIRSSGGGGSAASDFVSRLVQEGSV